MTTPASFTAVIARYNESIDWCDELADVVDLRIFNKGGDDLPGAVPLPNVGREAHTYYKFIVDNYDALASEYYVFLQGHPFDHSPGVIAAVRRAVVQLPGSGTPWQTLSEKFHITDMLTTPGQFAADFARVYSLVFGAAAATADDLFHASFVFGEGAQFIVSRAAILAHPREFYERIVACLDYDISPIEGYVMERLHEAVFCGTEG